MFGQETKLTIEHEILKENHENLKRDYESLQERMKHVDETYEMIKLHLQRKSKELEVKNANLLEDFVRERNEKEKYKKMFEEMKKTMENEKNAENKSLLEDCVRERNEKEKYKKMFEEMKKTMESERNAENKSLLEDCVRERKEKEKYKKMFEEMKKTMEDERNAEIDELRKINLKLLLENKKEEEELEKMEKKYVELAEKFCVVEAECAHLYDAEVAASGTPSAVMSGIGETENLIDQGENEVNHSANKTVTDAIVISDESDAEHEKENPPRERNISSHRSAEKPPRESNISSHQSVDRNQEEQCRNRANSSNENQASGGIFTPRSTNHPLPFTAPASTSSSSSSSSSDGYNVVVKLPANWPDWATPKGPGNGSNKP